MPRLPMHFLVFLIFLGGGSWSFAASLPGSLSATDIDQIVQLIGEGSVTRILRSAETYRKLFPGIKLGVEFDTLAPNNLENFGDASGSMPSLLPLPRFYIAKSLPFDLETIFSFFPAQLANTVSTWGGILKWTFYDEDENFISAAAYVGYTSVSSFGSNFSGGDTEIGALLSKDYVRFRPYLGLGYIFAHGAVNPALASTPVNSSTQSTLHPFLGAEFNLPVDITAQIDLLNLSPRASISIGKAF